MATNELFQYSLVTALMDGVAETGIPITTLLTHGDHGLGTFRHMVGEMIVLDGKVYQMKSDGTVASIDDERAKKDTIAPFAQLTRFRPTTTLRATVDSKQALFDLLSGMLPKTKNHFIAFRIRGVFKNVTVRTVGGQTYPRQQLVELGKLQVSHTFTDPTEGTVFGFRSPAYSQGISVAGDHFHFITQDRKRGGHVLAVQTDGDATIEAAAITTVHIQLPTNVDFEEATLQGDHAGIVAVEG